MGETAAKIEPIYSTIFGNSADVMAAIFNPQLTYAPKPGSVIADMTYGRGVFWKKINASDYTILGSDIVDKPGIALRQDARQPALKDGSCDVVVLDPPFGNNSTVPRKGGMVKSYNLMSLMTPQQVIMWYIEAIRGAVYLVKPQGLIVVKCQDCVNNGRQYWMSNCVFEEGSLKCECLDRFVLIPPTRPNLRHPDRPQQHARKWGSTFWVFRKRKGA